MVGAAGFYIRLVFASCVILLFVSKWCTVTVIEPDGRRHSLDVLAESTYDAAHLFVVEAKKERAVGLPKPTLATVFEVVARAAGSIVSPEWPSSAGLWSDGRNGAGREAICSASGQDWNDGHLWLRRIALRPRRFSPDRLAKTSIESVWPL